MAVLQASVFCEVRRCLAQPRPRKEIAVKQSDIDNWFSYHAPTPEQLVAYNDIRIAGRIFAETINKHCPESADKTAAIRKLRECVMTANASIACFVPPIENGC
jgi:hypothetical protein